MFHFMQIWFKIKSINILEQLQHHSFLKHLKFGNIFHLISNISNMKTNFNVLVLFTFAFLFILFWLSFFWFKGKRADQLQGLINRDRPPEKWRSPMSIFQALFAFLLWNVLLVTVDLFISQFFFHNSELWVV